MTLFSEEFLNGYNLKDVPWGGNGLGEIVYKRTYARLVQGETRTENWKETIVRAIKGAQAIGAGYTQAEAERMFDHLFNLRGTFSGRALWQLGTKLGSQYGDSLNNCWTVSIRRPKDFLFIFDELMMGGGVGYSVKRADINELPRVKKNVKVTHVASKDADFIVPDSREGWVKLLKQVLDAYFVTGKSFTYSTILVRGKGEPIKGFGGKASGPLPLIDGVSKVGIVLRSREGKKLRSIDVLDVANIIGSVVISGNVRRSAQIAVGDSDDILYLRAKRWDLGNIPNWRAFSNNTVAADAADYLGEEFWDGYNGKGEPYGLFNQRLSQTYGRLGELIDDNCELPNPCAEQILESYESCNLAEIYLPNIRTLEEFKDVAVLLYKTCKAITRMEYLYEETNEVIHRNSRIGIGITGIVEAIDKMENWADAVYKHLREFDNFWSDLNNTARSIKLTTVKPSGCSVKESLILTEQGVLRLEELVDVNGVQWQDINYSTTAGHRISKGYVNGRVATKKITTADGFVFESSLNHKYLVNEGVWKEVRNIQPGDSLRVQFGTYTKNTESDFVTIGENYVTNTAQIKQPLKMSKDLAFFFGLLAADGSTHSKGIRISFNRRDNDLIVLLKEIVKENFGLEASIDSDHGFYVNSVQLLRWLEANGLSKDYSYAMSVPRVIRTASADSIRAYITGFWRGDGGQHNLSTWSLCSVSRDFAHEIAVLCRAVGFNVSIKNAGPGGYGKIDRHIVTSRATAPNRYHGTEFKDRFVENGEIWLDPIASVVDSENETYDVSVEHEDHKYLLNGAESHNTLSLLAGVTPGVHPAFARHYIRRVRMASDDALVEYCRAKGYDVEYARKFDGSNDYNTSIVSFPAKSNDAAILAKDMTAIRQLELVKRAQTYWSDSSVSVTVYYRKEELAEIKEWLAKNYENSVKSVSFLLHSDHGFDQAPYEEISEELYNELSTRVKLTEAYNDLGGMLSIEDCEGGACPVR